jgi:hypothetical protein
MQCPLCAGPLTLEDPQRFACRRGHQLTPTQLEQAAGARVSVALWMAIEALESQAEALRIMGMASDEVPDLAAQADADARILREVVRAHATEIDEGRHGDRAS